MVGPRDGQPGAHERAREAARRLGILWHAQTWFYTRTLGQHMQCAVESLACSAWLKSRALSRARILVESKMLWQSYPQDTCCNGVQQVERYVKNLVAKSKG